MPENLSDLSSSPPEPTVFNPLNTNHQHHQGNQGQDHPTVFTSPMIGDGVILSLFINTQDPAYFKKRGDHGITGIKKGSPSVSIGHQ
jgi:hypothetical protein